jgi:hypothetical protein
MTHQPSLIYRFGKAEAGGPIERVRKTADEGEGAIELSAGTRVVPIPAKIGLARGLIAPISDVIKPATRLVPQAMIRVRNLDEPLPTVGSLSVAVVSTSGLVSVPAADSAGCRRSISRIGLEISACARLDRGPSSRKEMDATAKNMGFPFLSQHAGNHGIAVRNATTPGCHKEGSPIRRPLGHEFRREFQFFPRSSDAADGRVRIQGNRLFQDGRKDFGWPGLERFAKPRKRSGSNRGFAQGGSSPGHPILKKVIALRVNSDGLPCRPIERYVGGQLMRAPRAAGQVKFDVGRVSD